VDAVADVDDDVDDESEAAATGAVLETVGRTANPKPCRPKSGYYTKPGLEIYCKGNRIKSSMS
jgi:hypothetical protein